MRARVAGVAVALALACAAPCAAAPTAVHGWPVRAPAGSVHQGPGGGAVVVNQSAFDAFEYTVSAYRLDGRRRWVNRKRASCGNCDEGPQPARRQADGTYGLIGVAGDDFWSVTQAGRRVRGCAGAVLPDGTCIATQSRLVAPAFDPENSLVSRRGAAVLWSVVEPDLDWIPEDNVPPFAVRDGAGNVYTAYGQGFPDARFVVVDGMTGGVRARVPGSLDFIAATADSGLALDVQTLVAIGPDGARRWSAVAGGRGFIDPQNVIVDRARGRIYVGRAGVDRRWTTTAFAAASGAVLWRSPAGRSVRPLSLAQGGLLLAGVRASGARSVQSLGLDGRTRWTFRTASDVVGARELTGRTVVVSTDRSDGTGPLWRIDPLRR